MTSFLAALPMYDWPERRSEVDAEWAGLRDRLRALGVSAPDNLVRRNGDMPAVHGGIRDVSGVLIAPDPGTLPVDDFDIATLSRHPQLLLSQTCWGPMELGLDKHVRVVGQPDYSDIEGGRGEFYSSPIVMCRREADERADVPAPGGHGPLLPLAHFSGGRFAFNNSDSMSGLLAITRDLAGAGESMAIFSELVETGGHRLSIRAVAEGRADVATIDCRSWDLARRFEPAAHEVVVVGWTAKRRGLPYITALATPEATVGALQAVLRETGMVVA